MLLGPVEDSCNMAINGSIDPLANYLKFYGNGIVYHLLFKYFLASHRLWLGGHHFDPFCKLTHSRVSNWRCPCSAII